jgi:hypothetical protein
VIVDVPDKGHVPFAFSIVQGSWSNLGRLIVALGMPFSFIRQYRQNQQKEG